MDTNIFVCTGRLTKDLELRYTPNGKAVAQSSIAINRKFKDQEKTTFVDFTVWDKGAEIISEYTKQGSKVLLKGRLEQDTWEKDGKKFSKLFLVVEDFQFLDKKE